MDDESVFLGIDFGTSKCVMSWYNPKSGQAEIIRNSNDREETPSLIYFGTSKKDILVGQDAVDKLENTVDFSNCQFVSVKRNIKEDTHVVLNDGTTYTPEDLVKELFLKLKRDAELFFGNQPTIITRAVITYPELFDELQQERIENAARAAGFAEVKLLSEPTAAVITYCSIVPNDGKRFLVYDFGAGTANIAIIKRIGDEFLPLGSQPRELSNCGGDKLDRALYKYCERLAYENFGRPISFIPEQDDPRFLHACRKRKENLWNLPQLSKFGAALLDQHGKQRTFYTFTLDRQVYVNEIRPEINKTIPLTKNIRDQMIASGHRIDKFLVIGGTSRIPLVTDLLAGIKINPSPWKQSLEPRNWSWERNFAVALGAAYCGQKLWGVPRIQKPQEPYVPPLPRHAQFIPPALIERTNPQQPFLPNSPSEQNYVPPLPRRAQFIPPAFPGSTNRERPFSFAMFVPVLLFGALAVVQYAQGKDISVTLHPWITSPYTFPWPVTVALALFSLLLFNRSGWGMFLTVAFFVVCLSMTILIPLELFSLTIPFVPGIWSGSYVPWWGCGLLTLDLFGVIVTRLGWE